MATVPPICFVGCTETRLPVWRGSVMDACDISLQVATLYRLIAEAVAARPDRPKPPSKALLKRAARVCADHGLFADFNLGETEDLL